jgi:hypothetical protein
MLRKGGFDSQSIAVIVTAISAESALRQATFARQRPMQSGSR